MKPYLLVLYNRIRFGLRKLFRCNSFISAPVQLLGRNTRLSFSKTSHVAFGAHLVSNGRLVIVVGPNACLTVGERTYFNEGSMISCLEAVSIGRGCRFGPNVRIFDNDHRFSAKHGVSQEHITAPVTIGAHCWLGANVTVLRGTQIGDNCVIGAGCVVKGSIPAGSLVTQLRELNIRPIRDEEEA